MTRTHVCYPPSLARASVPHDDGNLESFQRYLVHQPILTLNKVSLCRHVPRVKVRNVYRGKSARRDLVSSQVLAM